MESPQYNAIEINNYLPHRAPMLFVDILVDIHPEHVSSTFVIKADTLFVQNGRLQEIGVIENAAQTCSSVLGQTYFQDGNVDAKVIGFISAIKYVKIYSLPQVGDEIFTQAELIHQFESPAYQICTLSTRTQVAGTIIAEAEINLFLQKQEE
jgi:predicted hotdog family 3-hydroxylacyl-ACP dehydratase